MAKLCLCCGKPLHNENTLWHAACIKKMFGTTTLPTLELNENHIIDENISEGKTVPGVQKKFSYVFNRVSKRKTIRFLNNKYIIKTESEKLKDLVLFEWVGMKLAVICGIETVECGIIHENHHNYFITKRIDRLNGRKIPMEDFCQLSNVQTEYKYNGSYEMCYKNVIQKYSDFKTLDKIKFYRLIFFSYIIGNTDMHLKNFSLYEIDGKYQLTPAYDLLPVVLVFPQEEMALTMHGKNQKLTKNDFYAFGEYLGISKELITKIQHDVIDKKEKMFEFINQSPLNQEEKLSFINLIKKRIAVFSTTKSNSHN